MTFYDYILDYQITLILEADIHIYIYNCIYIIQSSYDKLVTITTRIIAAGWDHGPYFDPESSFGGSYTRHGCFGIEGVDLFDCSLADAGSNGGWGKQRGIDGECSDRS